MEATITTSPSSEFEVEACHRLREYVLKESFADEGLSLNSYDREHPVHHAPNSSLVFKLGPKVIGSVRMDRKFEHREFDDGEIRLALFAIDPGFQGRGFGRLFFEGIKTWCRDRSISTIFTNSRVSSHKFWESVGFVDEVWDELLDGEFEIQMTYKL